MAARIEEQVTYTGPVIFAGPVTLPSNCVGDSQASSTTPIGSAKVEHQYLPGLYQSQAGAMTAVRFPIHMAHGVGRIVDFKVNVAVAASGDSTGTVDLLKNGTSVLSAAVALSSSDNAYTRKSGSVTTTALAAGDLLEVVTTISAGSGQLPKGLAAVACVQEAAG